MAAEVLPSGKVLDVEVGPDGRKRAVFRDRALYDADGNLKAKKFLGETYAAWRKSATPHPPKDDPEVDADPELDDEGDEPEEDD
jgi:hypothetical protein